MGNFLKDAIKKGVGEAVGKAVEAGVTAVAKPKIEQAAANASNKVANKIEQVTDEWVGETAQAVAETQAAVNDLNQAVVEANGGEAPKQADLSGLGSLFGSYVNAATSFATSVANNMKECPKCGELVQGDLMFCPHCGSKLPEKTIGDLLVCPECGFKNALDTKFCAKCGAKLSAVVEAEKAFQEKFAQMVPAVYPAWPFDCYAGEMDMCEADSHGNPYYVFRNDFNDADIKAYKELLVKEGFDPANEYIKEVDGKLYAVQFDECITYYIAQPKKVVEEKKESIFDKAKEIKGNLDDAADTAKKVIGFFKK